MSNSALILRSATPADVPAIFQLIQALAEYEKLSHAVTGTPEFLESHLFGESPYAETIIAEYAGKPVGFALFFHSYSTFLTKPGIYLEDLFVLPEYRNQGIGKALLSYLARLAITRGCGRLDWSVLDWNEPAIAFYRRMGASIRENSRICRVTGESLTKLADGKPLPVLRSSVPADVPVLFQLIQAQAEFNQQSDAVTGNAGTLSDHLFGLRPYAEAIVAEYAEQVVGFALFFYNYSTFLTKPGIYIEDLFIFPEYRQKGIGKSILTYLAQEAVTRNCGRLEWTVAIWNEPTINFYQHLGASVLPDWRICRVAGDSLLILASQT